MMQRLHGVRVSEGRRPAAEDAADSYQIDIGIAVCKEIADGEGIGNERYRQVQGQNRLGNGEAGGRGIQHHHVVFLDDGDGRRRHAFLRMLQVGLAQLDGVALVILFHQIGTAVGPDQLPGHLHLPEITPHGFLAAAEHLAQPRHQNIAGFPKLLIDQVLPFNF